VSRPDRPLAILHVYKDYAPVIGGIENHVGQLARAQAAAGHTVTVLVTDPAGGGRVAVEQGVKVSRARRLATVASTPLSWDLARQLAAQRPDLTHLHVPYPVAEAAWLARGRPPLVVTYHSDVVRQRALGALWAPGLRRLLQRAARVLATNPNYAASSPFLRRVEAGRLAIVPLGIDPAPFEAARERAGWPATDGSRLVFVGRLRYYKGLEVLLAAMPSLPGVTLTVIGDGPEGPALAAQAAALGLEARVRWLGSLPDEALPAQLAAADTYVLPAVARSEAFGIVLLQAMAAGLPLVTTELGTGTSWVNRHGETGLVVPPRDPAALAAALQALQADAARREALGRAGQARVRAEFTETAMVQRVEAVYRELAP
jgi:rhamnosyl/mannosyltransferase